MPERSHPGLRCLAAASRAAGSQSAAASLGRLWHASEAAAPLILAKETLAEEVVAKESSPKNRRQRSLAREIVARETPLIRVKKSKRSTAEPTRRAMERALGSFWPRATSNTCIVQNVSELIRN